MGEAGEEWLVATQEGLGKLIAKPKMTEKYLKKPPFRFLHDIMMEVTRSTGFGTGLYTPEESDAGSLADKSAKVEFLNKAISLVCFALNEKIDVSANKIVAGLEADKTNIWLQKLHIAATTCADQSESAVSRVLAGESVAAPKRAKSKKEEGEGGAPPPPDAGEAPADPAAAAEDEAKKKEARRKKREEEKRRAAEEEAARAAEAGGAADVPPAPPAPPAAADDGEDERRAKKEEDRKKKEERKKREEQKRQQAEEEERNRQMQEQQQQEAMMQQQQQQAAMAQQQQYAQQQAEEEQRRQMMMQQNIPDDAGDMPSAPGSAQAPHRPAPDMQGSPEEIAAREAMMGGEEAAGARPERPRTAGRKPPKVTSKVTTRQDEPGLTQGVAPPTIITEGAKDDDDEDMFEAPVQQAGYGAPVKQDENAPHGKLVRDLLADKKAEEEKERLRQEEEATREEVTEPDQKGIKMGKLKRKKENAGSYTEIDTVKLSESIQQLCQAANPLGKSIDLVHQDIANMGKELDHWKQEYREANEQYQLELKNTEELLQPLYQKISEIDDRIAEQKDKIRNSRSRISKNDLKIQSLLESVVLAK